MSNQEELMDYVDSIFKDDEGLKSPIIIANGQIYKMIQPVTFSGFLKVK